jgi:flavin reductase (DIM6/NTAB) family NADH-FMN oxidoreductase RutF
MDAPIADRFREALRRTASGVAILTTGGPAGRAGVTISTLCSLSMEPPSVIACVHQDAKALEALLANGVFAANALTDDQSRVAQAFAGQIPELRADRFGAGTWRTLATGAPALDGALACFDCRIAEAFAFGTHRILVGEVVAVADGIGGPLVFSDRNFRRLAAA